MNTTARRLTKLITDAILDPSPQPTSRTGKRRAGWPGLYLGYGARGPVRGGGQRHALIIGPPRSGKTTRLIVPNVGNHPGPVVVTSTKPDVIHATIAARTKLGRCWLWDPSGTINPPEGVEELRWSPIVGCVDWDQAVATAHALAAASRPDARTGHDAHWVERAEALLAPLLHAAARSGSTLATVLGWLHTRDLTQPMSLLTDTVVKVAKSTLEGVANAESRERSGIFSTADSILAAYRTTATLHATRNPNFNPAAFPASRDTIYLCSPGSSHHLHAPLVVALLNQIRTHTYRQPPNPPLLLALDELANIAPLPDLPHLLAEGGSQGLNLLATLQDLSQARNRWHQAADGLLTLFTHTLILPGIADTHTLRQISDLAGQIDVQLKSTSRTNQLWAPTTTTWAIQQRPRLPLDTIATGRPGRALLISAGAVRRVGLSSTQLLHTQP